MSYTVKEFPSGGRGANYPWAKWTDGRVHVLVRGEDYERSDASMRTAAHMHARRSGLTVRCVTVSAVGVAVQFMEAENA